MSQFLRVQPLFSDLEILAPQFQGELISAVEQFKEDNIDFENSYAYEGINVKIVYSHHMS